MFIIQTENNGVCTAKNLVFENEPLTVLPPITLKNARKKGSKDVWVGLTKIEDEDVQVLSTLCKSSTDDYLQCESLDCSAMNEIDEKKIRKMMLNQKGAKIRSQEIDMHYPILVYNVGLRRIKVQSMATPDKLATFDLFDRDFITFVEYRTFADIGLKDKRSPTEQKSIPFEETGNRVAFLTRNKTGPEGAIFLNVLEIDTYASPMKF